MPRLESPITGHTAPSHAPAAPKRLKVYLVEDHKILRETIIESLRMDYDVDVVGWSATEAGAIEDLSSLGTHWDVALVDLQLLQGTGIAVVKACSNRAPHQEVFILSNFVTTESRGLCARAGANGIYDKAMDLERVFRLLQSKKSARAPRDGLDG